MNKQSMLMLVLITVALLCAVPALATDPPNKATASSSSGESEINGPMTGGYASEAVPDAKGKYDHSKYEHNLAAKIGAKSNNWFQYNGAMDFTVLDSYTFDLVQGDKLTKVGEYTIAYNGNSSFTITFSDQMEAVGAKLSISNNMQFFQNKNAKGFDDTFIWTTSPGQLQFGFSGASYTFNAPWVKDLTKVKVFIHISCLKCCVQKTAYTLTYDLNGGSYNDREAPVVIKDLPAGTYALKDVAGATHASVDGKTVMLAGWSLTPCSDILTWGDAVPPDTVTSVKITNKSVTVYAVWKLVMQTEPGHYVFTHDGIKYDLEIPSQIKDGPVGLIVDMHGGGMNADTENDGSNMRALGQKYGYAILQPSAPRGMITINYDEPIFEMITTVIDQLKIDENRIHVMGFSMGGAYTWRTIRDHSDLFASAAPLSTGAGTEDIRYVPTKDNMPKMEIPIISSLGWNDPIVPLDTRGMVLWDAILDVWDMGPGVVIAGDDTYQRTRYSNANGTVLELILHAYTSNAPVGAGIAGGHCFPGSSANYDPNNPPQSIPYGCEGETSFHLGEEVIKFFIAHPKNEVKKGALLPETAPGHYYYTYKGVGYDIEIPEKVIGLVVDMHGGTMDAEQENNGTNLRVIGSREGYVIIQPSIPTRSVTPSFDDTVFEMINIVVNELGVDKDRIHVTGFSQGGWFTWRSIRDHSDFYASAAPMSAGAGRAELGYTFAEGDMPEFEIPVLYMHGTQDQVVLYSNGIIQRDAVIATWKMGPGLVIAGDDTYTRTRYTNANGTVFEFLQHNYASSAPFGARLVGGHCFPGSTVYYDPDDPFQTFACEPPNSFNWGEEVIKFFIAHPKNEVKTGGLLPETAPGHYYYTYNGVAFDLEIPEEINGLILDVHGSTMDAEQENNGTNLRELGPQYGYVILQPSTPTRTILPAFDDIIFGMVNIVVDELGVDENRIHVTGFSNGSRYTWRTIRDHSDYFASAAPASSGIDGNVNFPGCTFTEGDMPEYEIPVLFLYGKQDSVNAYATGLVQRDAVLAAWNMGPGLLVAGDDTYTHTRYTNANGTVFEFLEHNYYSSAPFGARAVGGHCFPGSTVYYDPDNPFQTFACEPPNSFVWGEEMIKFFIAHPKNEVKTGGLLPETAPGHYYYTYNGVGYDIEIPEEIIGLVVDMHGATMDAGQENNGTNLREIGSKEGYVVLQPSIPTRRVTADFDDTVFEMVNIVVNGLGVDKDRIHVTGFSMGGWYTWRTIRDHSDFYASAAPVAAGAGNQNGYTFAEGDMPEFEIPILFMHGTQDQVVLYSNGIIQRDAVITMWNMGEGAVIAGDDTYVWTRYVNANGTVFEFLQHDYASSAPFGARAVGGHCFPGSTVYYDPDNPFQTFACEPPNSFVWGEEVMKFFIAHPKIHAEDVEIDQNDVVLGIGDTLQATATISPWDAVDKRVTWFSNDESVATVDACGLVTAIGAGEATITVTTNDGGCQASFKVSVALFGDNIVPGQYTLTMGGIVFQVMIPDQWPDVQCGLIIDQHGATMTPQDEDDGTNMRELGNKYGYVVVNPEGPNRMPTVVTDKPTADMVYYLIDLLDLDADRIHMTGFSMGGMMTWRFIRDYPDLLASAAPASSAASNRLTCTFIGDDIPPIQIPILFMYGTQDPWSINTNGRVQVSSVLAAWDLTGGLIGGDDTYRHYLYTNDYGTVFEYFEHDYSSDAPFTLAPGGKVGGHCFPGGKAIYDPDNPAPTTPFGAQGEVSFNWGEEVIRFFMEHPKIHAADVEIDQSDVVLDIGDTLQMTATISPWNAADKRVTWSSSNEGVATIDGDGLLTAVGIGAATITATANDGGYQACCDVSVILDKDSLAPGQYYFKHGGMGFFVMIPDQWPDVQCGLIVDIHGATMTPQDEDDGTNMRELGNKYGYIVVNPEGPNKLVYNYVVDVPTIEMVRYLIDVLDVDADRVHVTGFSMGAWMTWRFVRDYPDIFASAAPASCTITGTQTCTFLGSDVPSIQIPILYAHGTRDTVAGFSNGLAYRDRITALWNMTGEQIGGDDTYRRYLYTSDNGIEFEFIEHDYFTNAPFGSGVAGGHCFPGGKAVYDPDNPAPTTPFGAQGEVSYNWGEEVIKFFIAHPRSAAKETVLPDTAPGHYYFSYGDFNYDLEIPEQILDGPVGLILDVHGATMDSEQENNGTNLRELGKKYGYAILQPTTPTRRVPPEFDAPIFEMVSIVIEELNIDEDRIHVTGFSNGGRYTWRTIRDHSDLFASAAPASAGIGGTGYPGCTFTEGDMPEFEIPIIYIFGTKDTVALYEWGAAQLKAVTAAWNMGPGLVIAGDDTYTHTRYINENGTVFEFISHDYYSSAPFGDRPVTGHCFPGSTVYYDPDNPFQTFACEPPNSFNWGEEMMKFFIAHPKNEVKTGALLPETAPGHYNYTYNGVAFDLEIPEEVRGLVLDVHGMTMDADQENNGTNMRELGKQYGYVILQPSTPTRSILPEFDDIIFGMVNIVVGELGVDEDRIHVTGFSNGGRYTWRTIRDHSDYFASAAPAASGVTFTGIPGCTFTEGDMPEFEIPILYLHGTRDTVVTYESGIAQLEAVRAAWNMGEGVVIAGDDTYTRTRYVNGNGIVLEFISHDYYSGAPFGARPVTGHCFPGSTVYYDPDNPFQTFACEPPNSFNWGEEVMKFFIAYPKNAVYVPPVLEGISVAALPDKTSYIVGEALDLTGMVVTAGYSDGSAKAVSNYVTSPANGKALNTIGTQKITVAYIEGGMLYITDFSVAVNFPAVLESIAVSENPDKMSYFAGESLDLTGMVVTATYTDGSTKTVTDYFAYPAEGTVMNKLGTQTVFILYAEGGFTMMALFSVTVAPVPVFMEGIIVSENPDKMSYTVGESLDLTGMVVVATYTDGSTKAITGYTVYPMNGTVLNNLGTQTVMIFYVAGGELYTTDLTVTVSLPTVLESITVSGYQEKYLVGDIFDLTGMAVTAAYSDGSTKNVTGYVTSPANGTVLKNIGAQAVFVAYAEGGVTALSSFDVTVSDTLLDTAPGHYYIKYNGVAYDLEIPEQILDGPVGLIIDQHGYTMDAQQEDNGTNLRELGRQYGYAILQPSIPTRNVTVDFDVPIFEMVSIVMDELDIDADRIHVTGFSQGGRFSWRFIRDHSDILASAAPAASGINPGNATPGCNFVEGDMPEYEIPVLYIMGTRDGLYPDSIRQRDAIVAAWNMGAGLVIAGDDTYTRTLYTNANGTVFEFIEHNYYTGNAPFLGGVVGGHCFPGSTIYYDPDNPFQTFACEPPNSFNWGEELIKFFIAHPKNAVQGPVLPDTAPGHYKFSYKGIIYDVEVPAEVRGLVLDVHGMTMDADQENDGTNLREVGSREGYVILQPSTPTRSILPIYDDRLFEMVNIVVGELGVDEDRIHVTGFSNGGRYTWRTIRDHSDFYASAAPAASGIVTENGCTFTEGDMPEYEIPILFMLGTQDQTVRYSTTIAQRDAVIAAWNMGEGVVIAGDDTYTQTRYTNANGTVFEVIMHDYTSDAPFALIGGLVGGHCFPGSTVYYDPDNPKQTFACEGAVSFNWGEEMIKFFIAHPKNAAKDTILPDTAPGHYTYTYDGVKYDLEIPEQILDGPRGLILDMHGLTMDADQENDGTNLRELGRQYGYVILQPSIPTRSVTPDFDGPVFEMVNIIMDELDIDADRIHVTGFSMGARFSWRFIRDHSDILASAAPAASGISPTNATPGCKFVEGDMPEYEIPILYISGIRDSLYPDTIRQRDAILAAWNMGEGSVIAGDDTYTRTLYTNANGTVFEFIEHNYYTYNAPFMGGVVGGHCFPGSTVYYDPDNPKQTFACEGDNSFHWGEELIKFFIEHPKS